MNSAKKARLEADGWKVGTAAQFLGLRDEEIAYVEIKLALARILRAQRVRRKLPQTHLAKLIGLSADLLLRSALALGIPRSQLARAIGSSRRRLATARRS